MNLLFWRPNFKRNFRKLRVERPQIPSQAAEATPSNFLQLAMATIKCAIAHFIVAVRSLSLDLVLPRDIFVTVIPRTNSAFGA